MSESSKRHLKFLSLILFLKDSNYPIDNPSQTYSPSVVWERPMTVVLTGLSRVFVREYFKGTSGC